MSQPGETSVKFRLVATPTDSIRTLFWLRNLAIAGQLIVIATVYHWLHVSLPITGLLVLVLILICFNLLIGLRLRLRWPATYPEVSAQLAIDMLILGALLYLSGGATNPFVSLYLLPVAIAAVALPRRYAWSVAALAIVLYSCLMKWFVPLDYIGENMHGMFSLHVGGMWIDFIISALLMAGFLIHMAAAVKKRDQQLASMREASLRNEHINAVGALAAGAAHELGTPLSTVAILVSELEALHVNEPEIREDLGLIAGQIRLCRERLSELLDISGHPRGQAMQTMMLRTFLEGVFDRWRLMRPTVTAEILWQPSFRDCRIVADPGLSQTLISLLNNAADATFDSGGSRVTANVTSDDELLHILIDDEGPGLDEATRARLGETFFTTKEQGWGLGLAISNINLSRLHGEITLKSREAGGIRTEIRLPLADLKVTAQESQGSSHG